MNRRVFDVAGNRLTGGVAEPSTDPRAVVVLCHGTPSGHPDDPADPGYPGLAQELARSGFEVWWFNFRGARDSAGTFTLGGWLKDLVAVVKEVSRPELPLFVVGASAGGAVALIAAAREQRISGVATLAAPAVWENDDEETLYAEALRVGTFGDAVPDEQQWWDEFLETPTLSFVGDLAGRSILLVQGDADPVVDVGHARRLFDRAAEPRQLVILPGAGHQLRRDPRAIQAVRDWLDVEAARLGSSWRTPQT